VNIAFAFSPTGLFAGDLALIAAAALAAAGLLFYRRSTLPRRHRTALTVLRALALALVLALLLRPIAVAPPLAAQDVVVPVLVDVSRSMRVADADGLSRIARARAIAEFDLIPALSKKYRTPLIAVGDGAADVSIASLDARARTSDLVGGLARVRERFREQRVPGIVLLSDGADTGQADVTHPTSRGDSVPVFAIGMGSASSLHDREVLSIVAGEQRLADASIDIRVSTFSSGFGRAPYELRLLAEGKLVETRRVTPAADGSPDDVTLTVVPDPSRDIIYTAEIPAAPGETIAENNTRSVLVRAAGRKRRLLVMAGAPGFEHSFMTRAWSLDPGLEVDSVVLKGQNGEGRNTFVIQAGRDRGQSLASGFPARREDLFAYDAVIVANVEGRFFTQEQLKMMADYVSDRGGGLLVAGSRSLAQRGLIGTPLEPVLPVELDDRRGTVARTSLGDIERTAPNHVAVTLEGATHPIMRLGASGDETRTRWAMLPALAASTPLGQPRSGASVLAVVAAPDGGVFPVVAVQKYGRGRSMIFGGEASWRWRMLAPSADRSHELFWRQAARWLSQASPDPVSVTVPDAMEPGDTAAVDVDVRDLSFTPVRDAAAVVSVSLDGSDSRVLPARRNGAEGHLAATFTPDRQGVYRIHAEAMRGSTSVGSADRSVYVGGHDREFADPRLNEGFLRRLAADSGGQYVRATDASRVPSWLDDSARHATTPERRDVWDRAWVFILIVLLLSTEWTLRRRWGLR
jgi:uncharacterized membrane protein